MWLVVLKIFSINNIKTIAIALGIAAVIWIYKDWQSEKRDNARLRENTVSMRKYDSLNYASQTYNKKELEEYLNYNRQDLIKYLENQNVKLNRISRIITQKLNYKDTQNRSVDLTPVLEAIRNQKRIKIPVIDSTKCMVIKGWVVFDGDSLRLDITSREFWNKTDIVSFWEREKRKILGINTRLFGPKTVTIIIKDDCGNSKTFIINKKTRK